MPQKQELLLIVDRVINVWNVLPSTVNFASLNVLRNSTEKTDFSSFLVCSILLVCCVHSNCFIIRFRAAVSVVVGPCCLVLLKLHWCKCTYCIIIGQIKWWWWWWWWWCDVIAYCWFWQQNNITVITTTVLWGHLLLANVLIAGREYDRFSIVCVRWRPALWN